MTVDIDKKSAMDLAYLEDLYKYTDAKLKEELRQRAIARKALEVCEVHVLELENDLKNIAYAMDKVKAS